MKQIKTKKKSHKQVQRDLKQKMNMFDRLPENCLTCEKPFDKLNREQVMSWNVVVSHAKGKVRLYCPECWDNALKLIEEAKEGLLNRKEKE